MLGGPYESPTLLMLSRMVFGIDPALNSLGSSLKTQNRTLILTTTHICRGGMLELLDSLRRGNHKEQYDVWASLLSYNTIPSAAPSLLQTECQCSCGPGNSPFNPHWIPQRVFEVLGFAANTYGLSTPALKRVNLFKYGRGYNPKRLKITYSATKAMVWRFQAKGFEVLGWRWTFNCR